MSVRVYRWRVIRSSETPRGAVACGWSIESSVRFSSFEDKPTNTTWLCGWQKTRSEELGNLKVAAVETIDFRDTSHNTELRRRRSLDALD